jgi:hypothetical protein
VSLERKEGNEVRGKVSQKGKGLCAGTLTRHPAPPILFCAEGRKVGAGARKIRPPVSSLGRTRPQVAGWRARH